MPPMFVWPILANPPWRWALTIGVSFVAIVIASAASAVIAFELRICLTVAIVGNVLGTQIENTTMIPISTYTAPIWLKARPRRTRTASDGRALAALDADLSG